MEYYSAFKKKEILSRATGWMNLEGIVLAETSQTEKGKYCTAQYHWHVETESGKVAAGGYGVGETGRGW